jgi:hypothetical protein
VDNIIILTGHSEANDSFIAFLGMLFPECEIQVLSRRTGNIEDVSVFPGPAPGDSGEKKSRLSNSRDKHYTHLQRASLEP